MSQSSIFTFAIAIGAMLLGTFDTQENDETKNHDENSKVFESTGRNLRRFCAKCTLPRNGVYIATFSDNPEPSTVWLLSLAGSNIAIAKELELTDSQIESIKKLDLGVKGQASFDMNDFSKTRKLLTAKQLRKLELAGLLIDGGPALRSEFFGKELGLNDHCMATIASEVETFRKDIATPALRATFAGGRNSELFVWRTVSDSVLINHQIIEHLDLNQRERLVSMFFEAEKDCQKLVALFLEAVYD